MISWSSDEGRSDEDPFTGIQHAFKKCLSKMDQTKATALGLTNCLNFGHPNESMGAFAQTMDGLAEISKLYGVPVISGNVSLYNAPNGRSIKPTPNLVMVGVRNKT